LTVRTIKQQEAVIITMNLFILSMNFRECAEAMFDKHVSKMILEAVQMLCATKQLLDPEEIHDPPLYKVCHKNHPVTIWMRQSLDNYMWTLDMIEAMHTEWKFRYNHPEEKQHRSYIVAQYLRTHAPHPDKFPSRGITTFALAMPDQYKVPEDPVESYRRYYQSPDKQKIATWKRRNPPEWYTVAAKA